MISPTSYPAKARAALTRPVHALPVDLFRVLVGLLSVAYFTQTLWESIDITNPAGLMDHVVMRELFPHTLWSLFFPGMTLELFRVVFAAAIGASLMVVVGHGVKWAAGFLFLVASSTYRWNFLVIFVDDSIFHLAVFWLLLLPVGRTLRLGEWMREGGAACWERWRTVTVPGTAVHCFLANLALLYVVAGVWKFTSPMWRGGTALYAILKLPLSYAPDFWRPEHLPLLKIANYGALIGEPLIPLMFWMRRHHPLKYAHLALFLGMHVGIIATLMVPYANVACLAALVLIFREELMGGEPERPSAPPAEARTFTVAGRLSLAFLALLTVAMVGEFRVPHWRAPTKTAEKAGPGVTHNWAYVPLWAFGIAQSYRLMDWIDDRNFHLSYEVLETAPDGSVRAVPPARLFPRYPHSILLQAYLHDVTWGKLPSGRAEEVKSRLRRGFADRYCRRHAEGQSVSAWATLRRVTPDNLDLSRGRTRPLMSFECGSRGVRLVRSPDAQ